MIVRTRRKRPSPIRSGDVLDMMRADSKIDLHSLHADGGPTRNGFIMQFTSDITRMELKVSDVPESSAWGAAMQGLLGLGHLPVAGRTWRNCRARQKNFRLADENGGSRKNFHAGWLAAPSNGFYKSSRIQKI